MSRATLKAIQAAAGNAGEAVYVDDVFSTYLYDGTGSGQTITNGIDLAGEGGLVWGKPRNDASNHVFMDTERYPTPPSTGGWLSSDSTAAESTSGVGSVTSWNSDGLGITGVLDFAVHENVLWTFRKQPGFFDVVTYTGNGTAGTEIAHNLGSTPGMIIIKRYDSALNWYVAHRYDLSKYLVLNQTAAASSFAVVTATSDTTFTLPNDGSTNASGGSYVAYLFAHDAQEFGTDEDESIIKCGSVTTDGSGVANIDLGYEPQWVLVKNAQVDRGNVISGWIVMDSMRGFTVETSANRYLTANSSGAESSSLDVKPNATGFRIGLYPNEEYIYVAIRRPQKPASEFAATDLFSARYGSNSANEFFNTGFDGDLIFSRDTVTGASNNFFGARLTGQTQGSQNLIWSNNTTAETATSGRGYFGSKSRGYYYEDARTSLSYLFRRAPGFFDVVAYTGTGSNMTIPHNLGVAPELFILKKRNLARSWGVYSKSIDIDQYLTLNTTGAAGSFALWQSTAPTATQFTVGTDGSVNGSGDTFVVYLFATVPGISKVGSYTGTASDVNVNCGFTSGARFVLVKRTDSTGDWYVWDSVRGIVAGNDPYLLLNSNAPQVTSTDYIDPLSSGFTITSTAPAALNASGGTYIFLAIA
jgi:hypothetical protein